MSAAVPAAFGVVLGASVLLVAGGLAVRSREVLYEAMGVGTSPVPPARLRRRGLPSTRPWLPSALTSGIAAFAGWKLLGPGGLVAGAVGGLLAARARARRGTAREHEVLEEQFRDAVVALAAAVRAGLSVRRALEEVASEAEPPLRPHLQAALHRLHVGEPLPSVLDSLAAALATPDAPLLVTLLAIHRRAGGDLAAMLEDLGSLIGQRRDARRELRALTAQGRASGAVLAVLPIAFVTLLSWTGGDGLGDFYRTPAGSAFLLGGLGLEAAGFLWIRRLLTPRGMG